MNSQDIHIIELETELSRLKGELEKAAEQREDIESIRKAMLYLLEDMKESAAIIERGKKEWEVTFDAIADPIFIHDKDFRIIRANKAYATASGMPFKEVIGKPYYTIFQKWKARARRV